MEEIIEEQKQKEYEEKLILCEKCGEPTGVKLFGDESYSYCEDCNWITH